MQPEAGLWARSKLRPEKHNSSDGAIVRGRNYRCDTGGRHGEASASDAFSIGQNGCGGSLRDGGECGGHLCRRSPPRWLKIALPAGCDKATLERITRLSCRISSLVRSALSGCLVALSPQTNSWASAESRAAIGGE